MLASGWRRVLIALVAGAASNLALAPIDVWPILFATFPALVWLIDGAAARGWSGVAQTAATGWWFGFGYFFVGVYWVGHAFLVDAENFGWLLPFVIVAMPAILAISTAIGVCLARLLWVRGAARILALAIGLTAGEWLRGHAFTGFPWDLFGLCAHWTAGARAGRRARRNWGLTFITVAVFASPATLADDRVDSRQPWLPLLLAIGVLAALALFGTLRLSHTATTFVDGVRLRIMQPNLQQDEKFNYAAKAKVMSHYVDLSSRPTELRPGGLGDVTHLIWPESAFPFYLTREADVLAQIAGLLSDRTVLITGADRTEALPGGGEATFNSIYVINRDGSVAGRYDKVHLVPFGEYLPFQSLLERLGLMQLTKVEGGYSSGARRELLAVPWCPAHGSAALLRDHFCRRGRPARRAAGLDSQSDQRWMVRHQHGSVSAPPAGARPRHRRGAPFGARGQFWNFRGCRSARPDCPLAAAGGRGRARWPLPQAIAPTLYARFGDGPAAALMVVALFVVVGWRSNPPERSRSVPSTVLSLFRDL